MIGLCITCKTEIEILGTKRFCGPCKKERNSTKWKIWNDQRPGINKTKYECHICKNLFFSKAKRKHQICHKVKCQNYYYNLSRQMKVLRQRIEKAQKKLVATQTEYQLIMESRK